MEHLALEIFDLAGTGSKFATLPGDTRIHIRRTSQIFGKGDVWTYSFQLNIPANVHIFGTSGEIHGSRLHEQINKRRARLWVEGLPLYYGFLRLADEVDVDADGNVDISFESGHKTFEDMMEGFNARDVPMLADHLLGVALWRRRPTKAKMKFRLTGDVYYTYTGAKSNIAAKGDVREAIIDTSSFDAHNARWPKYVVSHGEFLNSLTNEVETIGGIGMYGTSQPITLNTDAPYNDDAPLAHPYCNVWVAYQKRVFEGSADTPTVQRGYDVSSERRVNSAPSFFVMYWLRALLTHLGVHIEENQMNDVEDLRRLFMLNTLCAYEEPDEINTPESNARYGYYVFGPTTHESYLPQDVYHYPTFDQKESGGVVRSYTITHESADSSVELRAVNMEIMEVKPVGSNHIEQEAMYRTQHGHRAYATSDCFPDKEAKDIIAAVENGFGVRFIFDSQFQRVRIVLLRNIFRSEAIQELGGDVISITKTENSIRAFRLTYGGSEEDTNFYHALFNRALPSYKATKSTSASVHSYGRIDSSRTYPQIIRNVTAFDNTIYITPNNGNAWVGKVDKDAKRFKELFPSLFEHVPYIDAEDGDFSGDEESIKIVNVGFTPLVMNDVNYPNERRGDTDQQQFALFIDGEMMPRRPQGSNPMKRNPQEKGMNTDDAANIYPRSQSFCYNTDTKNGEYMVESDVCFDMNVNDTLEHDEVRSWDVTANLNLYLYETYRLMLQDNFKPNDDDMSPIETHDCGLTFGVMRGSGSDAHVKYEADAIGGEDNEWWELVPGSSATAYADICDNYGRLWNYNGQGETITTATEAQEELESRWPASRRNAPFYVADKGYICSAAVFYLGDNGGQTHRVLMATAYSTSGNTFDNPVMMLEYLDSMDGHSIAEMMTLDVRNLIVDTDSNQTQADLLPKLCKLAYGGGTTPVVLNLDSCFSLKLRAEKPNPYFNPELPENDTTNRRYLEITDPNMRGRGLADRFYKEYSHWIRNARIAQVEKDMNIAELSTLDDTVKIHVGDVTGFLSELEYDVDIRSGLGPVKLKVMYI